MLLHRFSFKAWFLAALLFFAADPLPGVEASELACDTVPTNGTFTVSADLSCAQQITLTVTDGLNMLVSASVNATISKLRFEVKPAATLTFSGSDITFSNNIGTNKYGGGVFFNEGALTFASPVSFMSNTASNYGSGGCIFNYEGNVTFQSTSSFFSNTAAADGGAIMNSYGNITFASDTIFASNSAYQAGAIDTNYGSIIFTSPVTFSSNTAKDLGGAILSTDGNIIFESSATFLSNTAGSVSGSSGGYGGVFYGDGSGGLTFAATSTFSGNVAYATSGFTSGNVLYGANAYFCVAPDGNDSATLSNFYGWNGTLTPSVCTTPTSKSGQIDGSGGSGTSAGLVAGLCVGGFLLLVGIGVWYTCCRKQSGNKAAADSIPFTTYDAVAVPLDTKDAYMDQAAPKESVSNAPKDNYDLEHAQLVPPSIEDVESPRAHPVERRVPVTTVSEPYKITEPYKTAPPVSPPQIEAPYSQRPVLVEAGLMAFAAVGAVASHIPWVKDIYGLCDEIVQLLQASERTSRNHKEVVSWVQQMQATLNNVAGALATSSDPSTSVNEALMRRAFNVLMHVKETMEQHARRNMLAQFLLSRKLQADLQEAGKYFIEAIQALQLGLTAQQLQMSTQQFDATTKLLSITMKIDDDLSDIMSVVKNNEVMLAQVILQLAGRSPSMRGDIFDDGSEASTSSLTTSSSQSRKSLVSEASGSSITDLEHVNRDFASSLQRGKSSKSVPVEAVVEALERLHIAPGDIVKLDSYPVGQGGFSKVYRVRVGDQIAAAKVVDLGALSPHHLQGVYKRFAKELYILSLLKSPYVVTVIGASATLDELSLVTEFMERGSLRKVMDDPEEWKTFTISMCLSLLLDVARGMIYLEEQVVRHRDLKSHNILVTADNRAKLIDFGLSKTTDAITKSTETSAKGGGGTLPWTAPELFDVKEDGTPEQGSVKSDVYSFGVVIWEILAGPRQRPWDGLPVGSLVNLVLRGRKPPLPPNALEHTELHKLMNDCMQFDPTSRPAFADVCRKLDELLHA